MELTVPSAPLMEMTYGENKKEKEFQTVSAALSDGSAGNDLSLH